MPDLIYEVQNFNENSCQLKLRRLFDQNGILFSKENNPASAIFKGIKGELLYKYYEVIDKDEEYQIRKTTVANAKMIVIFNVA